MNRIKWTDRRFDFNFPTGIYPEMIERVRGTPARLEELLDGLAPETLTNQADGRWSIQENAGHLLDLEAIVSQRIDEYLAGVRKLELSAFSQLDPSLEGFALDAHAAPFYVQRTASDCSRV